MAQYPWVSIFNKQSYIVFFFPQATQEEEQFIKDHGGLLSNIVECFTQQIGKRGVDEIFNEGQFFPGYVYDFQWLVDSAAQYNTQERAKMLPNEGYLITQIEYIAPVQDKNGADDFTNPGSGPSSNKKHHPTHHGHGSLSGQRTRFTVRELIKIFDVTSQNPSKKNKNQVYWQRFIKKGYVFPGRSVNSVNAQWQRFCHYLYIGKAIEKAVQINMPYSTMYPTAYRAHEGERFRFSTSPLVKSEPTIKQEQYHHMQMKEDDGSILGKMVGMQGINGSKFCKRVYPPMYSGKMQMKREDSVDGGGVCGRKRYLRESQQQSAEEEERQDSKERIIHSQEEDAVNPELFGMGDEEAKQPQVRQSDEIIKVKEEMGGGTVYKQEPLEHVDEGLGTSQRLSKLKKGNTYIKSQETHLMDPSPTEGGTIHKQLRGRPLKTLRPTVIDTHAMITPPIHAPKRQPGTGRKGQIDESNMCIPALECLFCIAKRIFVGCNNGLVSGHALDERFQSLDQEYEEIKDLEFDNLYIYANLNRQVRGSNARVIVPYEKNAAFLRQRNGQQQLCHQGAAADQFTNPQEIFASPPYTQLEKPQQLPQQQQQFQQYF
ncbi:hypothetical protein FGO68_gene13785 [Halteria grandinella]|uniref:Uncharacterized protein n=1 Tax=Halteria grandinella TaxID=5974 RepID=A0A8J8NUB3_HALGN|nr:hypothetical protein FGO68_gene13785 [Halteria grandinella]